MKNKKMNEGLPTQNNHGNASEEVKQPFEALLEPQFLLDDEQSLPTRDMFLCST